jgi:hypothetical protein
LKSEKIRKIRKKSRLNSGMIWKIWKKNTLNSEMTMKIKWQERSRKPVKGLEDDMVIGRGRLREHPNGTHVTSSFRGSPTGNV